MKIDRVKKFFVTNAPLIAMSGAGIGYIGTTFLAIRGTKKAIKIVDDLNKRGKPTKNQVIKAVWKCYIPMMSMGAASTILLCYAGASYEKRNRAAIAAYAVSERAFKEFREAVEEKLSEDNLEEVYEKIGEKRASETVIPSNISVGPDGKNWFLEPIGNHPFRSTESEVKNIIAELNMQLSTDPFDGYLPVEDYCYALGVTAPHLNRKVGWKMSDGFLNVYISPKGQLEDGTPCYVIVHRVPPKWDQDA